MLLHNERKGQHSPASAIAERALQSLTVFKKPIASLTPTPRRGCRYICFCQKYFMESF